MPVALEIFFRDMPPSSALEAEIRKRAKQLERVAERMTSCRVSVLTDGRHRRSGTRFEVHVDIAIPGGELALGRDHSFEDPYVAVREAFDAARRGLQDQLARRREPKGTAN